MKKLVVFFFLLMFWYSVNAQSFYINPKIGMALTATSARTANQSKFIPLRGSFDSPYSLSKNYDFFKNPTLPIGIGIGTILKNQRHKIELEWEKSAISYQMETVYFNYQYAENHRYILDVAIKEKMNRILVNYAYRLTKSSAKTSVWLNVSSGISFSSTFNFFAGRMFQHFELALAPNVYLNYINLQSTAQTNINTTIKLGFDTDLYHKEKYLFSLSLSYLQGFGKLQKNNFHFNYTKYNEENYDDMTVKDFSRELFSRGSALQLSISHRIQLYPWIPLSKKKRESKVL